MGASQPQALIAPRGLSRAEAARYIGVGIRLFDQMIEKHLMPPAKAAGGKFVWDVRELDAAFDELPHIGDSSPAKSAPPEDAPGSAEEDFV